jgi:hypothetical protein
VGHNNMYRARGGGLGWSKHVEILGVTRTNTHAKGQKEMASPRVEFGFPTEAITSS